MKQLLLFFILTLSFSLGIPACTSAETGRLKKNDATLLAHKVKSQPVSVIKKIRYSNSPERTRVVIDLSRPVSYQVTRISKTKKLVLQLSQSVLGKSLRQRPSHVVNGNLVKKIEAKQKGLGKVELSLTYKQLGTHKVMLLKKPNRLVLDLFPPAAPSNPFKIQTIVIDPGHGGKDPGAMSRKGLKEKDIVLDISRRLKKLIEKRLKKKVILTRNRDVFISLKKRTQIANKNRADLFISVHVNSAASRKLRGIEIYLLGRASSKRALATARRENAASHKAATSTFQKMILNDLEREFTQNASLELAHFTNNAIKKTLISKYPTPALGVKKAPFYVLSHTEMPAILAELSFISNRSEEKRLRSKNYRQRAAEALFKGLADYIKSSKTGN